MDKDIAQKVLDCVAQVSGIDARRVTLDSDLIFNLGLAGDDGVDLITSIRAATGAQLREYDFYQHFGPEAAFSLHSPEPLTVRQLISLIEKDLDSR